MSLKKIFDIKQERELGLPLQLLRIELFLLLQLMYVSRPLLKLPQSPLVKGNLILGFKFITLLNKKAQTNGIGYLRHLFRTFYSHYRVILSFPQVDDHSSVWVPRTSQEAFYYIFEEDLSYI